VLAIGNPDHPASQFAQICTPGSWGHVITVSAFDTSAYTGEKSPGRAAATPGFSWWVGEREIGWGVNSPIDQYFVDHGAGLLAALKVWEKSRQNRSRYLSID
jgi:hypothetical protein